MDRDAPYPPPAMEPYVLAKWLALRPQRLGVPLVEVAPLQLQRAVRRLQFLERYYGAMERITQDHERRRR